MAGLADFEPQEETIGDDFSDFTPVGDVIAQEEGLQEVEESEVPDFPALHEVVASPDFQGKNRFEQRAWLEDYKQDYIRFLTDEGLVKTKEERKENESLIDDAIKPHITSSFVGDLAVGVASTNPGLEMVQGAASIAQTFQEWRSQYIRPLHRERFQEDLAEVKEIRQGATEVIAEDPTRIGRSLAVEEQGILSGSGFGQIINKIGGDAPAMAAGFLVGGPAGSVLSGSYFALDAAGRIDVRSRAAEESGEVPKRSAGERLVRAGAGGALSAALETLGVGKMLGSFRKHMAGNAFNRVAAAAGTETTTELFQGIIEDSSISAEDKDDFILIAGSNLISSEKWKEAFAGGLIGGPVSAIGEASQGNINREEFSHFLDQNKDFIKKHKIKLKKLIGSDKPNVELMREIEKLYGTKGAFDPSSIDTETTTGIGEGDLLSSEGAQLQVSGLPQPSGVQEGDILSQRGAEVQEFAQGQETGISEEGLLNREQARAQGEATIREDAERNLQILMSNENFIKDNNIKEPKDLAGYLFRSGEFDRMTGIIDNLTNGQADAEGIIAKAINRQFSKKGDEFAIDPVDPKVEKEKRQAAFHAKEKAKADEKRQVKKDKLEAIKTKVKVERSGRGEFQGIPAAPAKTDIKEGDFLTAEQAKKQGEDTPANPTLTGPDPIVTESPSTVQAMIRESIEEQGGIDTSSLEGKDAIKTPEGNLSVSPRYKGTNESFTLDQHIEILKAKGLVSENVSNEQVIQQLQGKVSDIKQAIESRPSLERLKEFDQDVPESEIAEDVLFSPDPDAKPSRQRAKKADAKSEEPAPVAPINRKQIPFKLKKNADSKEVVTKLRDVLDIARTELDLPIERGAKFNLSKRALGQFDPRSGVIRNRHANDLQVAAHEIGHALSDRLGLVEDVDADYNQELMVIGETTSGPEFADAQIVEEGRAEFFRELMLDDSVAKSLAPKFHKAFHDRLGTNEARVKAVDRIKAAYQSVVNQDPLQRARATIVDKKKKSKGNFIRKTIAQFIDRDAPIKNLQSEVYGKEAASELEILDDAYKIKGNSAGVNDQVNFWIENGIHNNAGEKLSKSMKEIMPKEIEKYKDATAYLKSLRVIENYSNGVAKQDMSPMEAEAAITQYQKRYSDYRQLRKDVRGWNQASLDVALENDAITKEEHTRMSEKGKEYFPMARAYETSFTGTTGTVASPFKQQQGDTMDTLDGFGVMQDNATVLAKSIRQEKVNKALRKMAQHKNAGRFIERVDFETKETQVISVNNKGKRELYHIPDALTYDALVYSNASSETMTGGLLGILDALATLPASLVRLSAIFNPAFVAKNLLIDTTTAAIQSETGSIPFVNSVKGLTLIANKTIVNDFMLSGAGQGLLRKSELKQERQMSQALSKLPLVKNFTKKLDGLMKKSKDKIGADIANPIGYANALVEAFENAPRYDEFSRVYDKAMDAGKGRASALEEASYAARNLTIDFSKGGAFTKKYNKYVPFLNAGAQGSIKVAQVLGTKKGLAAFTTMVLLPEILLWALNKDDEEFKNINKFDKDTWWYVPKVWPVGEGESKYMRIPKPRGYSFIANEVRKAFDEDEDAHSLSESITSEGKAYALSAIPTFLKVPLEMSANHSFFKDRAIVNDYYKGTAIENQFHDFTTETAKFVGPMLNMSPIMFDHMAQGVLTRYWQMGNAVIDSAKNVNMNTPDKDFNHSLLGNLTGFGQFFGSKPHYRAKSLTDLATTIQQLDALKKDKKRMTREAYNARAADYKEILRNEGRLRSTFRNVRNLSKRVMTITDDPDLSSEEKRRQIDKTYERMLNTASKTMNASR